MITRFWWIALGLTSAGIGWLIWRQADFSGAVGNIVGSLVGTMIGVALALEHEKRKSSAERFAQRVEKLAERRNRRTHLKAVLREELVYNGNALLHLVEAVNKAPNARDDTWRWGRTIVDSFEFVAFRQLEAQPRTLKERLDDGPIDLFYRNLQRLKQHVRRAEAAHAFHLGFSADQSSADAELEAVRTSALIVRQQVQAALDASPSQAQ